jgi:hypothetical protein
MENKDYMGLVFAAWNYWRSNKPIQRLNFPSAGYNKDNCPVPV